MARSPTDPTTTLVIHGLHKTRWFPDLEALKFWKGRSGRKASISRREVSRYKYGVLLLGSLLHLQLDASSWYFAPQKK